MSSGCDSRLASIRMGSFGFGPDKYTRPRLFGRTTPANIVQDLAGGANRVAVSMLGIGTWPWQVCRSGVSTPEALFQKKVTSAALFRGAGKSGCSHRHPMPA